MIIYLKILYFMVYLLFVWCPDNNYETLDLSRFVKIELPSCNENFLEIYIISYIILYVLS